MDDLGTGSPWDLVEGYPRSRRRGDGGSKSAREHGLMKAYVGQGPSSGQKPEPPQSIWIPFLFLLRGFAPVVTSSVFSILSLATG